MTYEQFLSKCEAISKSFDGDGEFQKSYYPRNYYGRSKQVEIPRLYVSWSTGGVSGGSCWENSNPQPYDSNEPDKELGILDVILESMCPKITFLQYKNLINSLVKYDSYTESEYYGNCTHYSFKSVDVQGLYNYLKEKGFIE